MEDATEKTASDVENAPTQRSVVYELCNVFGTPTGRRTTLREGEPFPAIPKGWSWTPVVEKGPSPA